MDLKRVIGYILYKNSTVCRFSKTYLFVDFPYAIAYTILKHYKEVVMTANNKTVKLTIEENLETKEISVSTSGTLTFPIALHLALTALRGLKSRLDEQILASDEASLHQRMDFPLETPLEEMRAQTLAQMEGEVYDLINVSVSTFLDSHFPTVNQNPSLTESAATTYGLDSTATKEELLEAENRFIDEHPDEAALTSELQPKEIKKIQKGEQK